jgi:hypothetical protein
MMDHKRAAQQTFTVFGLAAAPFVPTELLNQVGFGPIAPISG